MLRHYKHKLLFAAFGFRLGTHADRQREKIDETLSILRVVAAHGETGEVRAVKRERRNAPRNIERAFPEFQADGASDALLRDVEKSVERFAQRCEPQTVVNQFSVTQRERLLEMRSFAVNGEPLQFLMRFHEQRSAGSFVGAARFHSDEAIFDQVGAADAVLGGNFIQRVKKFDRTKFCAIDGNGRAGFESDFDFFGFVRSFFRGNDPLPHGFVRRVGGIFELAAFVAEVPDVAVAAVYIFFALLDWHVVLLRVGNGIFAGIDVPFAPGSNDLDVRRDGFVGQFESDLIVAFPRAAVGKAVGAELQRNFRLALGDDGPRHGSAEEISVLVDGASAEGGPNVIAHKFFAQIFYMCGRRAGGEGLLARGFQVFLLADVADYGDDFAAIVFLEPGNDDGGVQASGIGEYDFFWFGQLCFHDSSLAYKCCQARAPRPGRGAPTKENPYDATTRVAGSE